MNLKSAACVMEFFFLQVVFYWTLLARHVSQHFDTHPDRKPILEADKRPQHQITLSPQQEEHIRRIFELFDTDGGGTIDRKELRAAMYALGFQSAKQTKKDMQLECVQADAEQRSSMLEALGSQSVSLDEFTALMKGELLVVDPLEEIKVVFAVLCGMDGGCSPGKITISKLRKAVQEFQIKLSDSELCLMISHVDADEDGSGTIDEKEFLRLVSFSSWF